MLVRNLGLPWLGLAGPLVAFVGSVPTWIGRVFPAEDYRVTLPEASEAAVDRMATSANSKPSESQLTAISGPAGSPEPSLISSPQQPSFSQSGISFVAPSKSKRYPGSPQFSDLVYALGHALGNPAYVYQVSELAGLNRGDLEDGFVNAPTRWYAALKLAVESGLEEALCREALRASRNRELHAAAAAYLG